MPRRAFLDTLQAFVVEDVIKTPAVRRLELKGQEMVVEVFEALRSEPERLLSRNSLERFKTVDGDVRVSCDHGVGMTDSYLFRTYDRLF